MRILITGANGRVGRVLCEGLKRHTLYKLDCATEGGDDDLVCADIADANALERVVASCGALDAVIHLAANPRVEASWEELVAPNIVGVHNLYECARRHAVPRVVFASTNRVSGMAERAWKREMRSSRLTIQCDPTVTMQSQKCLAKRSRVSITTRTASPLFVCVLAV